MVFALPFSASFFVLPLYTSTLHVRTCGIRRLYVLFRFAINTLHSHSAHVASEARVLAILSPSSSITEDKAYIATNRFVLHNAFSVTFASPLSSEDAKTNEFAQCKYSVLFCHFSEKEEVLRKKA